MNSLMIFVDWFVPGYKGGGQIRSCANLAFGLKDKMKVYVVTGDKDLGDNTTYPAVRIDEWNEISPGLQVLYLSVARRNYASIKHIITEKKPDCIYLNSMFSLHFTLYPLLAAGKKLKVVLAPRGMMQKGALRFKKLKKTIFFAGFKSMNLHSGLTFHATDITEAEDIRDVFGKEAKVKVVNDFPEVRQEPLQRIDKFPGELKCIFVSRISPKKNLLYLLDVLKNVKSNISFTIVGPIESEEHWAACKKRIDELPSNIKVTYEGAVPHHLLGELYRKNHLFMLTTYGENFGHVIFEAFLYGRPVLITNTTPWKNLRKQKLGWEYNLAEEKAFAAAIDEAARWNQATFDEFCDSSWKFAQHYLAELNLKEDYINLFRENHPVLVQS